MKKNVRFVLITVLLFAAMTSSAQFEIDAGYLNSTQKADVDGNSSKSDPSNGFHIEATYDFYIVKGFSIATGLNYSALFSNDEDSLTFDDIISLRSTVKMQEHYLDIPVRLKYTFDIANNFRIFAYGEAKFIFGISSSYKSTLSGTISNQNVDGDMTYNFYTGDLKMNDLEFAIADPILSETRYSRFDMQLGVGLGVELFNRLVVKGGYDWGLLNRFKETIMNDATLRRNQFNISLGFMF